jgi:hypothetical protein
MFSFREFFYLIFLIGMVAIYFTTGEIESMERISLEFGGPNVFYQAFNTVRDLIKSLARKLG